MLLIGDVSRCLTIIFSASSANFFYFLVDLFLLINLFFHFLFLLRRFFKDLWLFLGSSKIRHGLQMMMSPLESGSRPVLSILRLIRLTFRVLLTLLEWQKLCSFIMRHHLGLPPLRHMMRHQREVFHRLDGWSRSASALLGLQSNLQLLVNRTAL